MSQNAIDKTQVSSATTKALRRERTLRLATQKF